MTAETWVLRKNGVEVARRPDKIAALFAAADQKLLTISHRGLGLAPGVTITREDQAHADR